MKRMSVLLLGLCCALPVWAQDATDQTTPADASAAAPADSGTSTTPAPADSSAAPSADSSTAAPAPDASSTNSSSGSSPDSGAAPSTESSTPPASSETTPASDNGAAATPEAAPAAGSEAAPAAGTSEAPAPSGEAAPAAAAPEAAPAASGEAAPAADNGTAPAAESPSGSSSESSSSSDNGSASSESASAEASPRTPLKFYVGADYAHINFLISGASVGPTGSTTPPSTTPQSPMQAAFGSSNLGSNFTQVRVGYRVIDAIGIEAHFGIPNSKGTSPNTVKVNNYEGIYVVPTGTVFDTVEVSGVLGYSWLKLERPGASASLDSIGYGANIELPIRNLWDALPDIRLGGGFMVYQQNGGSRVYGTHFGARFDFSI